MKKGNGNKKRVLRGRAAGIMIEEYDSKLDLVVEKIESLETNFSNRFDGIDQRLDRVDQRLDRIESEIVGIRILLGEQGAVLKRHDQEIGILKQASSQ